MAAAACSPASALRRPRPARFLLFHVNFGVPEEYEESHIPGALYLDTNRLEDPADWNRRDAGRARRRACARLGITKDTTVMLYGRDTEGHANEKWPGRRAGQIAATRALMILRYAGVDDVRLLDGGYDWWVRGGNPVETSSASRAGRRRSAYHPAAARGHRRHRRGEGDHRGPGGRRPRQRPDVEGTHRAVSGYNYIGPAGRIAGDVWGNCGSDAYHMQHYRNIDNTMRAYPEITANWAEAGITPDKQVAFYCGTGWRASETWFYAYLQGWQRIAVYDGGWFEWSRTRSTTRSRSANRPTRRRSARRVRRVASSQGRVGRRLSSGQRPRYVRIPASNPRAYRSRPAQVVIRAASVLFFMLPNSTMTTGMSDRLNDPKSVLVFSPFVA